MPKSKLNKVARLKEGVVYATPEGCYFIYRGDVYEYVRKPWWRFWQTFVWRKV